MPMIQDMASFTVKSLDLYKVEPSTQADWKIINKIITDKLESNNG
jgi:hypothetical protein